MKTALRFLPLLLTLLVACQKDSLVKPSATLGTQAINDPQVQEAKDWFEHTVTSVIPLTSTAGHGAGHERGYAAATADWQNTSGFTYANGQAALSIPLHFQPEIKRYAARAKGTSKTQPFYTVPDPELFIAKSPEGGFQLEIREFEPDQAYMVMHKGRISLTDYSGFLKFYDWQGHLVRGYRYRSGSAIAQLSPVANSKTMPSSIVDPKIKKPSSTSFSSKTEAGGTTSQNVTVCITMVTATYALNCWYDACGCFTTRGVMNFTYVAEDPIYPPEGGPEYSTENCGWQSIDSNSYQVCNTFPDPTGPGPNPGTGGGSNNPALATALDSDPLAAFPPCPGLTNKWIPLINFKASAPVLNRLSALTATELQIAKMTTPYSYVDPLWQIQAIQNAGGLAVNLDRFAVTTDHLPVVNGQQLTAPQFLEYIRTNINNFVPPGKPTFSPQTAIPGEATRWQNHELGSIVSIDIVPDNGSVILSDYGAGNNGTTFSWKFSTLHDPYNGSHPVSGTREFGVSTQPGRRTKDSNGVFYTTPPTYTFYIQGADRILSRPGEFVGSLVNGTTNPSQAFQFQAGDDLWNGLIANVSDFMDDPQYGGSPGSSSIETPKTNRPNWADVLSAIQNGTPLQSSVPCN